jgi:hypothetical protein
MTNQVVGFSNIYSTDMGNVPLNSKDSEKNEVTLKEWASENYPEINWKITISYYNEHRSQNIEVHAKCLEQIC